MRVKGGKEKTDSRKIEINKIKVRRKESQLFQTGKDINYGQTLLLSLTSSKEEKCD